MNIFCGTLAIELDNSLSFVNYLAFMFSPETHLLCWGGGMLFEGRSSLCPRALRDVWLGEVSMEAGLSVKVPILETWVCETESGTGFTDTAEPAAAGETRWDGLNKCTCCTIPTTLSKQLKKEKKKMMLSNSGSPSRDCVPCIELKPFCKNEQSGWAHRFLWKQAFDNKFNGVGLGKKKERKKVCFVWHEF